MYLTPEFMFVSLHEVVRQVCIVLNFVDGVGVLKGMPPAATAQAEQLRKAHWAMAEGVDKSLILPWPDMPGHFPRTCFRLRVMFVGKP